MAKEELDRPQVVGAPIDPGGFGSPHRMGSVVRRLEAGARSPTFDDSCVLPSGEMSPVPLSTRE